MTILDQELQLRLKYKKFLAEKIGVPESYIEVEELYIDSDGQHHYRIKILKPD